MLVNGYIDKNGRDVSDLCRGQLKVLKELSGLKIAITELCKMKDREEAENKKEEGAS